MEITKYTNDFGFEIQENFIIYTDSNNNEDKKQMLENHSIKALCDTELNDQLIATVFDNSESFIIYAKSNKIYINGKQDLKSIFEYEFKSTNDSLLEFSVKDKYIGIFSVRNVPLFELSDIFTEENDKKIITSRNKIHLSSGEFSDRQRYITLGNIILRNLLIFITLDRFLNEIIYEKVVFDLFYKNKNIGLKIININNMKIMNYDNGESYTININKVGLSPSIIKEIKISEKIREEHILCFFNFKGKRYFIYNQSNGIHILRSNPKLVSRYESILYPFKLKNSFYLIGRFKHNGYQARHKYDDIYLQNRHNRISKFKRPFRKFKVLNQLVIGKVPLEAIEETNRIRSNLLCGNEDFILHNISLSPITRPMRTLITSIFKDNIMVMRNNLGGNLTVTSIPYSPEYSFNNKIKIKLAKMFSKKKNEKNVNLYFEKKSERAEESSIKVFDKVKSSKMVNSNDYFILDKKAPYYKEMKRKYGFYLIPKFSFRHYKSIYESNYFVSSELPNHIINDRIFIDSLRDKIMETPSVFLQHGIMFAKPVDNPMAFGFHKNYNKYNNIKNVVSSDLEAAQFYKMGYEDKDLIKTGLATFDDIHLDAGADRIAFMPTYRYWEERLIYSGDITKTSYFKSIIKIIHAFDHANLIDRLLIVPHNKFSEYIYENLPEYKNIIESNPSNALKKAIVFITDYSSAIYDSIHRGAFPIFYWEEKDYLIKNYKAIPPVNENNAPGVIAYNTEELIENVESAISTNYFVPESIKDKFKQINEFDDNKNTDRIVSELKKLGIL